MDTSRVAMVFAHPGHELTVLGMLQRYRPHVLYVTRADGGGDEHREKLTRGVLDRLGLTPHTRFLGVRERQSFERALALDVSYYLEIREKVVAWLNRIEPTAVFVDAFEAYNFHHDVCGLLVGGAVHEYRRATGAPVDCYELPLACFSISELLPLTFAELEDPRVRFRYLHLTPSELEFKWSLAQGAGQENRYVSTVVQCLAPQRWNCEAYRQVADGRDYCRRPLWRKWPTYDEIGQARVEKAVYAQPLRFTEHFLPLAATLTGLNIQEAMLPCAS